MEQEAEKSQKSVHSPYDKILFPIDTKSEQTEPQKKCNWRRKYRETKTERYLKSFVYCK